MLAIMLNLIQYQYLFLSLETNFYDKYFFSTHPEVNFTLVFSLSSRFDVVYDNQRQNIFITNLYLFFMIKEETFTLELSSVISAFKLFSYVIIEKIK